MVFSIFFGLTVCENAKTFNNLGVQKSGFAGTWKLISRIDEDLNNNVKNEPTLGSDPISILMYDTLGNMSVQIMKRNRKDTIEIQSESSNNSGAFNGYDAYFGTYQFDTMKKEITHTIEGSINPEDVGKKLKRNFFLSGEPFVYLFQPPTQAFP
jgi:hypothetical protein